MNVTELFSKVALFEGVAPEDRVALAKAAALRTYRRGETIVEQGQPGDAFYVIVKGRVAVAIVAPDGREVVLNSLGEGEHFGEMALLDDAPRSASVIAQEKSELAILSRAVFFDLLKSNFVLTRALLARVLRAPEARELHDRGPRVPGRQGAPRALLPRARGGARPEGRRRLVRRRAPVPAGDRRHDRLLARDGLAHDVPDGGRAAHRPEGEGRLRAARRLRHGDPAARLKAAPWSSAPGRCRTS